MKLQLILSLTLALTCFTAATAEESGVVRPPADEAASGTSGGEAKTDDVPKPADDAKAGESTGGVPKPVDETKVGGESKPGDVPKPADDAKAGDSKPGDSKPAVSPKKANSKQQVVRAKGKKGGRPQIRGIAPCLAWVNRDKPIKAVIVCVHGLGLHNGTYEPFGKRMADLGFATYAIDVRGFGAWMEAKGREKVDFDLCINDVRTTLKVVRRAHPGVPVFLLGESMGGAIALRVTSMYPELVDGLISSVPSGDRFKQGKTSLKVAMHLFKNPNKEINIGEGVVAQATKKEELRKAWLEDPMARVKMSPKELLQFQSFMNGNHECARKIQKTSVLIVQGCQDKLVRPEGTVELFNHLGTADRSIVLIPSGEHLIFEENQFTDDEIETVHSWITARLPKPETAEEHSEEKKVDKEASATGDIK